MNIKDRTGFTLIELMITIAIIAILTAAIFASVDKARAKARDGRRITDIKQLQEAIENYFSSCYEFPDTLDLINGDPNCTQYTPVLNGFPVDPRYNVSYLYYTDTPGNIPARGKRYHLCANLEIPISNSYGGSARIIKARKMPFRNPDDPCNGTLDDVYDVVGGAL